MSGNRVAVNKRVFVVAAVAAAMALLINACGGGGSSSSAVDNLPIAFAEVGQPDFNTSEPNANQATTNAQGLAAPQGGVATNGTLFYLPDNFNNRILVWNTIPLSGVPANFALGQPNLTSRTPGVTGTNFSAPTSVQIADNGVGTKLVVADSLNNRVLIWNTLPTSNVAPDVVIGQASLTTQDQGLSQSGLTRPVYAAIATNKLFVVDTDNNRVLIWNTVPTTNNAPADVVLGQPDFTTATAAKDPSSGLITTPGQKGLTQPGGLWTDGLRLLVADTGDNRVLFWTKIPTVNGTQATDVIGQADFTRNISGSSGSNFNAPFSVAVSDGGQIYVADQNNNRVVKFASLPVANNPTALSSYGQGTLTNRQSNDDNQDGISDTQGGGPSGTRPRPSNRTLSSPEGVTVFNGVLYVTDNANNRVMQYPQ